jgi:hypothetical protein
MERLSASIVIEGFSYSIEVDRQTVSGWGDVWVPTVTSGLLDDGRSDHLREGPRQRRGHSRPSDALGFALHGVIRDAMQRLAEKEGKDA